MEQNRITELKEIARKIRIGAIDAIYSASSGHPGGSLSAADILTYLYFEEMNVSAENKDMPDRDRFVLSKGHAAPALYAALAHKGYFPVEDLKTFRKTDSYLQGHPDMNKVPGVDMSAGSLGQGLSVACGMALSAKLSDNSYRVYTVLGDGECEEGQIWEAAMLAAHYKLDNLCAVVDWNGLQIDGSIDDVIGPAPFDKKFEAFGWNVVMADAHDFESLEAAFANAKATDGRPTAIIAKSVKGKGVSYMENKANWHGAAPKKEQYDIAMEELNA